VLFRSGNDGTNSASDDSTLDSMQIDASSSSSSAGDAVIQTTSEDESSDSLQKTNPILRLNGKGASIPLYSWTDVKALANITITEREIKDFYKSCWLPFCAAISSKDVCFTNSTKNILLPNLKCSLSDHQVATRGLCHVFLQRQQFLRSCRYILSNNFQVLLDFLKSTSAVARDVTHTLAMPAWYCPWIHDVAYLIGFLKHGYLALDQIYQDWDLPLTRAHLESHVRTVFLYGSMHVAPAARFELSSVSEADKWVKSIIKVRPEVDALEARLSRILIELTRPLSPDHPGKLRSLGSSSAGQGDQAMGEVFVSTTTVSTTDVNQGMDSSQPGVSLSFISDNRPERSSQAAGGLKRPSMSLKRFLYESAKRRKTNLVQKQERQYYGSSSSAVPVSALLPTLQPTSKRRQLSRASPTTPPTLARSSSPRK